MTAPGNVVGVDCKTFRNTASYSSPIWVEISAIIDVKQSIKFGEAKFVKRGSTVARYKPTIMDLAIDCTLLWDGADTNILALKTACTGKTLVDVAFLDGAVATSGVNGLRAEWYVFGLERTEGLEDGAKVSVTFKPAANSTNAAGDYTVP